jgi:hypothetical protein
MFLSLYFQETLVAIKHFYDHIEEKRLYDHQAFFRFITKEQLAIVRRFLICIT